MRSDLDSGTATGLTLADLVAMQSRHVHTPLAPGERFPIGMRPGRRQAQGVDVDGTSPYVAGDDVRSIDWRATARTGRTQMKRFVAESHLGRMLIVDLRPHMFFGTAIRPMAKTAALAAARLAWEAKGLHEPLGLLVVSPAAPDILVSRRGNAHLLQVLDTLRKAYDRAYEAAISMPEAGDGSPLPEALDQAGACLGGGDEICMVGDFGDADEAFLKASRRLADRRSLQAYVVEDQIFSRPVPRGSYPIRLLADAARRVARISGERLDTEDVAGNLRKELRRKLIRAGWQFSGGPYLFTEPGGRPG